jgi:hypothetical protein
VPRQEVSDVLTSSDVVSDESPDGPSGATLPGTPH